MCVCMCVEGGIGPLNLARITCVNLNGQYSLEDKQFTTRQMASLEFIKREF